MIIDPRFERSVRRWLRAYPRRWRTARADEMTAVLADLADPDATRLDVRSALSLVRSGLATRRRTRPPLRLVMAYRLLGTRLPSAYRGWVRDDIEGALYVVRVQVLPLLLVVAASMAGRATALARGEQPGPFPLEFLVMWLVASALGSLTLGPWRRRRDARKHLVADPDEPLTDQSLLFGWVMHDRLRARPLVGLVALLIVPTAVTGLVANPSPALAGAGALGVVVAAWVARGLRRRLPQRPEQPARRLVDLVPRQVALVVVLGAGGLVLTVVEALNVAGTDFSTLVTPVALVVLPGAVVAWRYTVRTAGGLAAADVLHIALTGEAPLVDTYRESLVPALVATD